MPGVVGTIPVDVPFVGHVELPGSMLEGVGVGVGIAGTPLMPAFPISVEPKGIPARLAPPGEIVEGDDEMVPLPLLVSAPPQGDVGLPDAAIPVVPPIPAVLPVAGVPPIVLVPPPSNVPVELVPGVPDVALPVVVHGMPLPNGMGLTPVVASPVAPKGMPAGATGGLPVMPNGEVGSMPGDDVDGICASAALPPRRAAVSMAINKSLTLGSPAMVGSVTAMNRERRCVPHSA